MVIGFLDFSFPKHNLIVDLKTTMKLPGEMSKSHQRQSSIYRAASGNAQVKFLYVSPKNVKWHEVEDYRAVLADTKAILNRQEAFLRAGDREFLRSIASVNVDSFYWTGSENIRREMYGL